MVWACRACTILFLTDDWTDSQPRGKGQPLNDSTARIVRGETDPKTDSPLEQMLHQIFRAIQSSTGMEQYAQFSRLTCECLRLQTPPPYTNITDYLAFRCYNSGGYFGLALARYVLDIYLSDDELQSPLVAECERLALEAVVLENDIVSYATELQQQNNTLGRNLVAIFLERGANGCTFSSASAVQLYLRARIADLEAQLLENTSAFEVGTQGGVSDAVGRWLRVLPYFVGGSAWWSQHTGRYNIPGHPAPRRVIYMEGEGGLTGLVVPETAS